LERTSPTERKNEWSPTQVSNTFDEILLWDLDSS